MKTHFLRLLVVAALMLAGSVFATQGSADAEIPDVLTCPAGSVLDGTDCVTEGIPPIANGDECPTSDSVFEDLDTGECYSLVPGTDDGNGGVTCPADTTPDLDGVNCRVPVDRIEGDVGCEPGFTQVDDKCTKTEPAVEKSASSARCLEGTFNGELCVVDGPAPADQLVCTDAGFAPDCFELVDPTFDEDQNPVCAEGTYDVFTTKCKIPNDPVVEFGCSFGFTLKNNECVRESAPVACQSGTAGCGIPMCNGVLVTIDMNTNGGEGTGTGGDDVILGTGQDDVIEAKAGNDLVCSGAGDDEVIGGQGADMIFGQAGDDELHGNVDNDWLSGGQGDDEIHGGGHDDIVYGDSGADILGGEWGDDDIYGGGWDDWIWGGTGVDQVTGNDGNDRIFGGSEGDWLWGGNGNDRVWGGTGDDNIKGGAHSDYLYGEEGDDRLQAQGGDDIVTDGGNGIDECTVGPSLGPGGDAEAVNCDDDVAVG